MNKFWILPAILTLIGFAAVRAQTGENVDVRLGINRHAFDRLLKNM
jgi:hypothetical protein